MCGTSLCSGPTHAVLTQPTNRHVAAPCWPPPRAGGRWTSPQAGLGSASALLDRANTLTNEPQQEVPGAGVAGEPARLVAVRLDVLLAAVRAVEGNRPPGRHRHVGTVT